jgi:hypothetical protein
MSLVVVPHRRLAIGRALTCGVVLFCAVAFAGTAVSTSMAAAAVASCRAASTEVWAPVEGAGTAGTIYYELEFSNVGHHTCTLRGYPSVWAITQGGVKIGVPAMHRGVPRMVTLRPGETAHAVLGVTTTGAVCGTQGAMGTGLRVVPPGQTLPKTPGERDEVEHFPLQVCTSQSSMHVFPVHAGTGIPNYTFP